MARLYRISFRVTEKEFSPDKCIAKKKTKTGPDLKVVLGPDKTITVLEKELLKYWEYGEGIEELFYAGELDDSYFAPQLLEPDFVDGQIRSKKNGDTIGYQG